MFIIKYNNNKVSFELSVDMLEGDHIFCENLEK